MSRVKDSGTKIQVLPKNANESPINIAIKNTALKGYLLLSII